MNRLAGKTRVEIKTAVQASAGLKLLAHMLTLDVEELDLLIRQELEENPALEPIEEGYLFDHRCTLSFSTHFDEPEDYWGESHLYDEEEPEPEIPASPMSLKEHVWGQLVHSVDADELAIAEFMVESLDHRGYLSTSLEEIALRFNRSLEEVERILDKLQQCDPPGVGARSLQECLHLQIQSHKALARSEADAELFALSEQIITEGWDHLIHTRYEKLARKLKIDLPTLNRVLAFIRNELTPYPASGFAEFDNAPEINAPREPDIVVSLSQSGFHVEIRGFKPHFLKLSPTYFNRYKELRHRNGHTCEEECQHLNHFLKRAQIFLQALHQREQTLKKIMQTLLQKQASFFFTGDVRFMQEMTRVELAQMAGLHRSTVGRAVRNKWLQLPNRSMIPMEVFFDNAYRITALVRQIIETHERNGVVLTDADIANKLEEMGIFIARRTVSKYRAKYQIFSSRWRERERKVG